jgi:hypothetical protein
MVKNAAWITPSGKWKSTIERSGRKLRAELRLDESVETHHKELNEFLERGNFWGSLPNYRTVPLQASRKSLFAITPSVPSAGRSPFSRGSGYGSNFAVHAWARAFCKRSNHFSRGLPNSVPTPLSTIASPTRHAGWGFEETERVVFFRRDLNPIDRP